MKRIIDISEEKYNQIINFYQGSKARPKDYEIAILNSIPLEQESVLDKIRAEIMRKQKSIKFYEDFQSGKTYAYKEVLDIIDKYKVESEDKE